MKSNNKYFHGELLEAYSLKWLQEEKFEAVQLLLEKINCYTLKKLLIDNIYNSWILISKISNREPQ